MKQSKFGSIIILSVLFSSFLLKAQPGFLRVDTIRVFDGSNNQLKDPWVGGHNFAQFSTTDLNFDGIKDLVVFDRSGGGQYDKITTYINAGTANQVSYKHAPQYEKKFPFVHDWMFLVDYNCDGKEDILTYYAGDFSAYKNISSSGNLQFTLEYQIVKSVYYPSTYIPLYVSPTDLPSFVDVDNDGDLDVITFQISGSQVEYHRNFAMENFSRCDTLVYYQECTCWGQFTQSTTSNVITLHGCTPLSSCPGPTQNDGSNAERQVYNVYPQHSGNCIACLDLDGDGDKDMINGGTGACNLNQTINGGSALSADMVTLDPNYPSTDVSVNQQMWPCPFHVDVNNDGKRDLLVSPNAPNVSENATSIIYYKNMGTDAAPNFVFQQDDLLQDGQIDIGEGSYPVLFDIDADGLTDILIGNYQKIVGPGCLGGTKTTAVTAYRNTGTALFPKFKYYSGDYANLLTALTGETNLMMTFGDLDGDGDADMIVGDENGKLHQFQNTAGSGNPAVFVQQMPYFILDDQSVTIDVGASAAPQLFDMDNDNLLDLVVGQRSGQLYYYHNEGTTSAPIFKLITNTFGGVDMQPNGCCTGYSTPFLFTDSGSTEMFVGSEQGFIYHYINIDGNLAGTFTKLDSLFAGPNEVWEGMRVALSCKDMNNDGLMDMVVGNYRGGLAYYKGDLTVGIHHQPELNASVELFPNPANNVLNFQITNMDPKNVEIAFYNLLGSAVLMKKPNTLSGSLDVSALANGVYVCKIISGNKQCIKKLVIKKS